MKFHLVHFHGPIFFLRPQKYYRDENEWREARQQFFESLSPHDDVSLREPRSVEYDTQPRENSDTVKNVTLQTGGEEVIQEESFFNPALYLTTKKISPA